MTEHRTKPLVQQYGATALRNLTLHNAENKKAIARLKGIDALISAMEAHPHHASVQQYVPWYPLAVFPCLSMHAYPYCDWSCLCKVHVDC